MNKTAIKSGFGIGVIIFLIAAVISVPLRTIQYFTVIEGGTGFYEKYDLGVYALYTVLAVSIIILLVLGFAKRKALDYSVVVEKRPGLGILSFVSSIGMLLDAIICLKNTLGLELDLGISVSANDNISSSSMVITGVEGIFAVISAVFFLALGISFVFGKSNGSQYKLLSLAPVIWSIARMVLRFMRTISFIQVSDLLFEMLMLVFYIEFFMAFAQVNSRVGYKGSEWKLAAFGLSAALLALVCFIPRFVVTLSGRASLLYAYSTAEYCDFATALFILATITTRCINKTDVSEEKSDGDTEE